MAELKKCWVVRDMGRAEALEAIETKEGLVADDLLYETTADGLVSLIIGTEAVRGRWVKEKTKIHTDEASARADAEKRVARIMKSYDFRDLRSRLRAP